MHSMHRHWSKPMVQRSVTMARGDVCTMRNGLHNKLACAVHGLRQPQAQGQICGNGRRQGASGAMHIAALDTTRSQTLRRRIRLHQQIHHIVTPQMPSFEQDCMRTHRQQIASRQLQLTSVRYLATQQQNSFIQIGVISVARGNNSRTNTCTVSLAIKRSPLVATITGSSTTFFNW